MANGVLKVELGDYKAMASVHSPYIGGDGYWYEWNTETGGFVKTDTPAQGPQGYTPQRGVDYWTEQDVADVQAAVDAAEAAQTAAEGASNEAETERMAAEEARTQAQSAATEADASESAAADSAAAAAGSAGEALESAVDAAAGAVISESWAIGGTDTREGEDTNNAKYWAGVAQGAAGGGVTTFNGRSGAVVPQSGDYTAEQVGARPDTWTPSAQQVGADPAGSAAAAEQAAKTYADTKAGNAETNAKTYADSLAVNYDPAGSAEDVQTALDAAKADKAVDVLATLTTAWVGAEAPYTQQVAIAGMKSDTKYEVGLAGTASKEQRELARAAMLAPFDEGQGNGYITIICDGDKPTAELPILVRMVY